MIRPEGPSAAALRGPPRTYPAYPRVDPRRDGITPPGDAAFVAPAACARARPDQLVARERRASEVVVSPAAPREKGGSPLRSLRRMRRRIASFRFVGKYWRA